MSWHSLLYFGGKSTLVTMREMMQKPVKNKIWNWKKKAISQLKGSTFFSQWQGVEVSRCWFVVLVCDIENIVMVVVRAGWGGCQQRGPVQGGQCPVLIILQSSVDPLTSSWSLSSLTCEYISQIQVTETEIIFHLNFTNYARREQLS